MPLRIWLVGTRTSSAPSGNCTRWPPNPPRLGAGPLGPDAADAGAAAAGAAGAVDGAGPDAAGPADAAGAAAAGPGVASAARAAAFCLPTGAPVRWLST